VTLRDRIPVEPLAEDRLVQLERRVVAAASAAGPAGHRDARRLGWRVAAVTAAVAAGLVGWIARGGSVDGAEPAAIVASTAPDRAVLDVGDARIASEPGAAFTLTRPAGGVLVAMTRGKIDLAVSKRGDRPPLIVRAGATDVIVVGTRFTVAFDDATGDVEVRVLEGVVRVVRRDQEARIVAGQAWQTRRGAVAIHELDAPRVASVDTAAGAPSRQTPDTASAAPRQTADTAGAAPHRTTDTEGAAPRATPDSHAALAAEPVAPRDHGPVAPRDHGAEIPGATRDHVAEVPHGPARSPTRRAMPGSATPSIGEPTGRRAVVRPSDPRIDLRTAIRAQPVDAALALAGLDAAAAVAKYYEIAAHTSGDQASQAFYSIAVVRHQNQGRDADALQALDAYVRRFPGGKEYRAALWLRVRILCLDKLDDRCRAAAYTYLHEAPDGSAARVAERITVAE